MMALSKFKQSVKSALAGNAHTGSQASDVKVAQDYVSSMTDVIQSTSEQQYLAMQKVTHLSKSLAKMEGKLARLGRVEAENAELTDRAGRLEADLNLKTTQASDLDAELSVAQRQLKSAQDELISLRSDASIRKDRGAKSESRIALKAQKITELTDKLQGLDRRHADMSKHNRALEEELSQVKAELSAHRRETAEHSQKLEVLERTEAKTRRAYESALVDLTALNTRYDEVKNTHLDVRAQLETAKFEARSVQTQHADSLRRREEENLSLKNRLAHLEAQLRLKDSAKQQAEHEITEVQHSLRLAQMRADQAETVSREMSREAELSASNVTRSQVDYDTLNAKFMAALEDVSTLKKLNEIQKSKLMQYAAVDSLPVTAADVAPVKKPASAPKPVEAKEPAKNIRILRQVRPAG